MLPPLLAAHIGAALTWLVVGLALAGLGVFVVSRIALANATAKVRHRMLSPATRPAVVASDASLSSAVTDGVEAMRRAGCRYLAAIDAKGHPVAILLSDVETLVEVTEHPWMRSAVFELTSPLMEEHGQLCSSNSPYHADLWAGEFRQTFPGASADGLLAHHRAALETLGSRGLLPDKIRERDALALRTRMLARANAGAATADRKRIQAELRRMAARRSGPVGPIQELPDFGERLDIFWRLIATVPSERR